jgi:molybdopterin converting factor small subunit
MITITLEARGTLAEVFGPETCYELADGATLGDLLDRIDREHGERLAQTIWNRRERRFRGPVVIMAGQRAVKDRATPLGDRQVVSLYKALVGG